jgi:hypothetical protein
MLDPTVVSCLRIQERQQLQGAFWPMDIMRVVIDSLGLELRSPVDMTS